MYELYVPSPITSSDLWRSLQVQTVFLPVSLKHSNKNVRTDVSNYFYYRVLVYWTGQTAIGPMCCWARSVSQCLCTYIIMPLLQRDATHKRGLCRRAVSVCLSVRPSVTFCTAETNKHIFIFFTVASSQTILVFPYQTSWQYSDGDHPNEGFDRSNADGVGKNRDSNENDTR